MRTSSLIALCGAAGAGALLLGMLVGEAVAQREPAPVAHPQDQSITLAPLAVDAAALPRLRARLDELEAQGRFMGVVIVAKGDRLLMREAYGPSDAETGRANATDDRFRLASVSKQFTAAAVLSLQDEGRLSVDDPVCRWITPCPQGWETIRLTHLLSHSSGLPDLMDRPGWGDRRVAPATLAELTAETTSFRPRFEPGARPRGWGFGLFTSDLGSGADPQFHAPQIYHTGSWAGFRNMVSYLPGQEVSVVVLTNNYHQRDTVFLIVQQAMAEAIGAPFPTGLQQ